MIAIVIALCSIPLVLGYIAVDVAWTCHKIRLSNVVKGASARHLDISTLSAHQRRIVAKWNEPLVRDAILRDARAARTDAQIVADVDEALLGVLPRDVSDADWAVWMRENMPEARLAVHFGWDGVVEWRAGDPTPPDPRGDHKPLGWAYSLEGLARIAVAEKAKDPEWTDDPRDPGYW